jgi:predicted phage terminase large subunit-like protein
MDKVPLTKEVLEGFVVSCLAKNFDGAAKVPQFHREMWDLCCGPDKYVAIAAPRRHAKSTAITLSYTLASLLFRNRRFAVIVSDTEAQACMFLGQIKQELQQNQEIIELFGIKQTLEGEVKFEKDTESDVIVSFDDGMKFRIQAKGAEQKLRGLLWDGTRPDLVVIDDLENDEIVMNKDRREKFRRWFYGALLPCISDRGVIRYVGTILHMDSQLERLMPNPRDKHSHETDLKLWSDKKKGVWRSVKYRAHSPDFEKILWHEKNTPAYFKELRADYQAQGLGDVYSQEILNIPLDESNTFFKRADFLPRKKEDKEKKLHYYIAGDLAISEKQRSDYTVFAVGGMDDDGMLHVVHVVRDRMDAREIVDTILALHRVYEPMLFALEEGAIAKAIGPFLNEQMIATGTFPTMKLVRPHADKMTRSRSIQARMRAGAVKFDKEQEWYQDLEEEMMRFPRDKHDDQVDALAYLGMIADKMIEAPTKEEQEELDYLDELEENNNDGNGRNRYTGY